MKKNASLHLMITFTGLANHTQAQPGDDFRDFRSQLRKHLFWHNGWRVSL